MFHVDRTLPSADFERVQEPDALLGRRDQNPEKDKSVLAA